MTTTKTRILSTLRAAVPAVGGNERVFDVDWDGVSHTFTAMINDLAMSAGDKTAMAAAANGFDWSDTAQQAWAEQQEPFLKTLRDQSTQAISDINTFLAISSPSNAQVVAEVRNIDQRQRAILQALNRLAIRGLAGL